MPRWAICCCNLRRAAPLSCVQTKSVRAYSNRVSPAKGAVCVFLPADRTQEPSGAKAAAHHAFAGEPS